MAIFPGVERSVTPGNSSTAWTSPERGEITVYLLRPFRTGEMNGHLSWGGAQRKPLVTR